MASGTFHPGTDAAVLYEGVLYPYKSFSWDRKKKEVNFTNFKTSGEYEEYQTGFKTATLTLEGPIDTDMHLPFNDDAEVTIITQVGVGYTASWPAVITGDTGKQDVEDGARGTVTARVTGAPTLNWGA